MDEHEQDDDRLPVHPAESIDAVDPAPGWGPPADPEGPELAGYGWRVIGFLVDGVIVGLASSLFSRAIHAPIIVMLLIAFAAQVLYAWALMAFWSGQTIGMKLVRLRCVDEVSLEPVRSGQAAVRALSAQLIAISQLVTFNIPAGQLIDLLWPAWDRRQQTLHDKVGKTVVLREPVA